MMRKLFFFLLIASLPSAAICQGKVLLSENFKDNKRGWTLRKDSSFSVEIKEGVLRWEKFTKNFDDRGCLWYRQEIKGFNTLQDFSITIVAKFLSGGDHTDLFDLQWGAWDKQIQSKATGIYQLNFFLRGDVKLDYFNKGWNYSLRQQAKELLEKKLYLPNQYNKYEIIQKNGFIIFNINDRQYFKQFVSPISGNSIGIQGCLKSTWAIDQVVVRQLKSKKENTTISTRLIIGGDSLAPAGKGAGDALKVYPNPFMNEFTVTAETDKAANATLELFDIQGNLLLAYDRKLDAGRHNMRMYADVPPGSYILKLTIGTKSTSAKMVKL
jgi:hypothetical protein